MCTFKDMDIWGLLCPGLTWNIFFGQTLHYLDGKPIHNITFHPYSFSWNLCFALFGQVLCHLDGKPSGAPLWGSRGHCIGFAFNITLHCITFITLHALHDITSHYIVLHLIASHHITLYGNTTLIVVEGGHCIGVAHGLRSHPHLVPAALCSSSLY